MGNIHEKNFEAELQFHTSKSGGPGGQHVNKVNSKVELRFNITLSELLSKKEKAIIARKLKNKINGEGELILVSQEERSQFKNKKIVLERFYSILEEALKPKKERKKTKPTLASRIKRLENKKFKSEKKQNRRPPEL